MTAYFDSTLVLPDKRRIPVSGTLTSEDAARLDAFRQRAAYLIESSVVRRAIESGKPTEMVVNNVTAYTLTTVDVTDEGMNDLLMRLRPFILANEPTFFGRVNNILYRLIDQPDYRAWIAQRREYFFGNQDPKVKITYNDTVITSDEFLLKWLNQGAFHVDLVKQVVVGGVLGPLPRELWQTVFYQMLMTKAVCIVNTGMLITALRSKLDIEVDALPPVEMHREFWPDEAPKTRPSGPTPAPPTPP